ncbi:MAG: hypothetical protein MJZ37_06010 [Bacilli bacterium]|nr:hypothetical protein [Bacilli bacterium]
MPQSLLTFIIIISIAAVIAIVAFVIYKLLMPKLKDDTPTEEEILNEEMTRILQPIDDAETAKQVSEYKNEEDE